MKKFLNSDWLRAEQSIEIQCQKIKYSANFIGYKIQPFLAEKNTKNPKHLQVTKMAGVLIDFLLKSFILKFTISHVTYARMYQYYYVFMYIM